VAEAFTGFPPSGIAFLAGLTAGNTKAYFDRNRGTYANDVRTDGEQRGPAEDRPPS